MKKDSLFKLAMMFLIPMSATGAKAQTSWKYTYDNTGNRTQRIVATGSSSRQKTASASALLLSGEGLQVTIDQGHRRLKVETLGHSGADIAIYDLSGKEVSAIHAESDVATVDISPLPKGVYVLSVEIDQEKRSCKFNK